MKTAFSILLLWSFTHALSAQSLQETYANDFLIGAAINYRQAEGKDQEAIALISKHFNTITPENMLKWGPVHPEPDEYNFSAADKYVALGEKHDMFIIGHTLVWHQQTPDWVFEDSDGQALDRAALLSRMQDHISKVAGRYSGKINGWDVVNEALNEDGSLRQTKWLDIIGEDYLEKAFTYAQQAAPEAELYYNDYNLWKTEKREGAVRLIKKLQSAGVRIDGIGMQGHYSLEGPSLEEIEASIKAFSSLGIKVMITELDVDVLPRKGSEGADLNQNFETQKKYNPYAEELPEKVQQSLAERYANLFALFYKHKDKIGRITLWGVADHHSWLNNWPMRGRTNYPLLFDRNYQPKPAFDAVVEVK
ncbi:endo-1,4-beta-xylanase [Porifericola rhodea]|uniref:endo-1,4-beta-xylanase n=1 Tax=Porifericola rhodea TaxID=930972 RepID=UPI0026666CF9|nr:endo-1,4-beta-xylanase [Porifericola rhodea]WKN32345.1 endo-1,4-beta-xylanase [Porifericola rhodea]